MVPLRELALIRFGIKTGADRFFCLRDVTKRHLEAIPDSQQFTDRWGISPKDTRRIRIVRDGMNVEHLIERRFLEPELHSLMEVKRVIIRQGDVKRMVLNAPVPRSEIRGTFLADYVEFGERQGAHLGPTVASRARTRPWYDLGIRPESERADLFWPKAQQYRHVVALNADRLVCKDRLYDVCVDASVDPKLLWAVLNSTVVMMSKHQFGRGAGIEGNLDTNVVDVNAMLVPDIRHASPEVVERAIAACDQMSTRDASRYLYEEFTLSDRRELDDVTLEILGIEDIDDRMSLRQRLYQDVTELQQAIRDRELIAQRDRRRGKQRAASTPAYIAGELWDEHESILDLLQFPEDFVTHTNIGDIFDLPSGEIEVGTSMLEEGTLLRIGTIQFGGREGEVIDVGSVSRGRFLEALSMCHRSGRVRLPNDEVCTNAVNSFDAYREDLRVRLAQLAEQRTNDQRRQRAITEALLRKALQWRRT